MDKIDRECLEIFRNKKILLTGHTGFKGSWMHLLLNTLGAQVIGVSDEQKTSPSLHQELSSNGENHFLNLSNSSSFLIDLINKKSVDLIIHFAGQALVKKSLKDPVSTFKSNTLGTLHVLEAFRLSSCKAALIITSDKCYKNADGQVLKEGAVLGGDDPYSASKAAAEIICHSYQESYFKNQDKFLGRARAGNVIGGGDWSDDRLIPDLVRSIDGNKVVPIRMPYATRPWQHVLDALFGYLLLSKELLVENKEACEAFNFGPVGNISVLEVLDIWKKVWPQLNFKIETETNSLEKAILQLDTEKAQRILSWSCRWNLEETVKRTASWYQSFYQGEKSARELCLADIRNYGFTNTATSDEKIIDRE